MPLIYAALSSLVARLVCDWIVDFTIAFKPKKQGVVHTSWALATVSHRDGKPFATLARAAERRLSELNEQGIAGCFQCCMGTCNGEAAVGEAVCIAGKMATPAGR